MGVRLERSTRSITHRRQPQYRRSDRTSFRRTACNRVQGGGNTSKMAAARNLTFLQFTPLLQVIADFLSAAVGGSLRHVAQPAVVLYIGKVLMHDVSESRTWKLKCFPRRLLVQNYRRSSCKLYSSLQTIIIYASVSSYKLQSVKGPFIVAKSFNVLSFWAIGVNLFLYPWGVKSSFINGPTQVITA